MRSQLYITFILLTFLVASCGKKTAAKSSPQISQTAELSIAFRGGIELKVPIKLTSSTEGTRSFSSNEEVGRNLATSIGYSYAGEVELGDNYSPNDIIKGHLIAFRISQFDPELKKVVFSTIQYGIFSGSSVSVFNNKGITISINSDSEQGVAPQSATRSESNSEGNDKPQPESEARSR